MLGAEGSASKVLLNFCGVWETQEFRRKQSLHSIFARAVWVVSFLIDMFLPPVTLRLILSDDDDGLAVGLDGVLFQPSWFYTSVISTYPLKPSRCESFQSQSEGSMRPCCSVSRITWLWHYSSHFFYFLCTAMAHIFSFSTVGSVFILWLRSVAEYCLDKVLEEIYSHCSGACQDFLAWGSTVECTFFITYL